MKRIVQNIIIMTLYLTVPLESSLAETVDIETAEARIKAIVAYELNHLSLKDNLDADEFNSRRKELETADSIDLILSVIQDFGKNVKFTKEIKSIDEKLTNKEDLLSFYTKDIYSLDGISTFLNNRPKETDELKATINQAVTNYLNGIEILDAEGANSAESMFRTTSTAANNDSIDTLNNTHRKSYANLIAIIVAVLSTITAILFLFRIRSLQSSNKEQKNQVEEKERHIKGLEKELEMTNRDAERKNREIKMLKDNIESLELSLASAKKKIESESQSSETAGQVYVVTTPTEYYVGSPREGVFAGGSETYRPGKSLFKITIHNGNIGDFEFVQRPEAIQIAQQSKSTFLESACNITNDVARFSKVMTKKKGRVERSDDGWKIISKADIYLE